MVARLSGVPFGQEHRLPVTSRSAEEGELAVGARAQKLYENGPRHEIVARRRRTKLRTDQRSCFGLTFCVSRRHLLPALASSAPIFDDKQTDVDHHEDARMDVEAFDGLHTSPGPFVAVLLILHN